MEKRELLADILKTPVSVYKKETYAQKKRRRRRLMNSTRSIHCKAP